MSVHGLVVYRPVPPPGEGPTERHIEFWRVLRFARQGKTWDCLVGRKLASMTVTQSSPLLAQHPTQPLIETVSGRRYILHGPPASAGPSSLHVEAAVEMLRAEAQAAGLASPQDVSPEYWARWCAEASPS